MFKSITYFAVILFVVSMACLDSGTPVPYITLVASDAWIFYALRKMDKQGGERDV